MQIKRLTHSLQGSSNSKNEQIDAAVKKALQRARRNVNILQKIGGGIYSVKGRTQVVIVEKVGDDEFNATFRPHKSHSAEAQTVELSKFVGSL